MKAEWTRREWLGALAATGMLLGIEGLAEGAPANLPIPKEALQKMATESKDGLVFVVPRDAAGRAVLGKALERLLWDVEFRMMSGEPMPVGLVRLLIVSLHEAVFCCASAEAVGAEPGEWIVLLNARGVKLGGGSLDPTSGQSVLASVRSVLDLEPHRDARLERLDAKGVSSLRTLLEGEAAYYEPATLKKFQDHKPPPQQLAAAFVEDFRAAVSAGYDQVPSLVQNLEHVLRTPISGYKEQTGEPASKPLFGVEWKFEGYDPCPPCGMSSIPSVSRVFLDFESS